MRRDRVTVHEEVRGTELLSMRKGRGTVTFREEGLRDGYRP